MIRTRKGDLEIDQLGKLILAAVLLLVMVIIIGSIISGEFSNQFEKIKEVFSIF